MEEGRRWIYVWNLEKHQGLTGQLQEAKRNRVREEEGAWMKTTRPIFKKRSGKERERERERERMSERGRWSQS